MRGHFQRRGVWPEDQAQILQAAAEAEIPLRAGTFEELRVEQTAAAEAVLVFATRAVGESRTQLQGRIKLDPVSAEAHGSISCTPPPVG